MASTPVQFFCPSGLTLTLELYPHGSDVIANGAGDACTEKTNCKGLYEATVTEALVGLYDVVVKVGTDILANYHVDLLDDTAIHRCGELECITPAVKTKTDYLPSATAGAAGGVLIAGSNAATTFAMLTVSGTTALGPVTITNVGGTAVSIVGGNGITIDATVSGVIIGATLSGINIASSFEAVHLDGGVRCMSIDGGWDIAGNTLHTGTITITGNIVLEDGATISAPTTLNRPGLSITGNGTGGGIESAGGVTGPGIFATGGGNAAAADGMRLVAGGALAAAFEAATISGTLSGTVGGIAGTVTNLDQIASDGVAVFDRTTDSLQAIRDRGDAAWISDSSVLLTAEIATVTSQTVFTLATGSDEDDAYNGQLVILYDDSNSDYPSVRYVTDYVGATRTLTINTAADFTVGDDDSLRIVAGTTAASVWGQSVRTLTQTAAEIATVLAGTVLTIQRGDTLVIAFADLGSLAARSKLWFSVKRDEDDEDTEAQIEVMLTTPADAVNDGLLAIAGDVATTKANAAIVVDDETDGDITVTIAAEEVAKLVRARDWVYDVQMLTTTGVLTTLTYGACVVNVESDVTRATS